jgi:hypothetical protein
MDSGAMIYIQMFLEIGEGMQKLIEGIYRHTDRKEIS